MKPCMVESGLEPSGSGMYMQHMLCKCNNGTILFAFQGEYVDVEKSISTMDTIAPFIVAFGPSLSNLTEFKVVIEKNNVLTMPDIDTALHCCFAAYYIFNISYTPDFKPFLLFLEKYVYRLTPSCKLPLTVSIVIDSLKKTII